MAKLWQFLQGHLKPAFSKKKWKGATKENVSKIAQKTPRLKGPKGFWRKCHFPLISMHLKTKDWEKLWRKKRLKECPNCQVMANFERSPKTRVFSKRANGGPKEIFKKSPNNKPSLKRPKSTLAQMALSSI